MIHNGIGSSRKRPHDADLVSPVDSSSKRVAQSTDARNSRAVRTSSIPGTHNDRVHVTANATANATDQDTRPDFSEIFNTIPTTIWDKIFSYLSPYELKQLAQTDKQIRDTIHEFMFDTAFSEYQTMDPSCLTSPAHREAWIIQLIINKCMQDLQTVKDPRLLILSKNRAAQIRDVLPNHSYLVESLVAYVSEISDPIIVKKVIYVSSLIKNQMSLGQCNTVKAYYSRYEMELNWVRPTSSDMKPYFDNPVISCFAQNTLLKRNAPIDFIGSYDVDGSRIDRSNSADRENNKEDISMAYNGNLHVFFNEKTRYLKVSAPQVNGSHSISCEILTPEKMKCYSSYFLKVSISPNHQWIIMYSAYRNTSCWIHLYEYQQNTQGSAASLEAKKINLDGLLSDSHKICNIQFTKDSEILVISIQLKKPSYKKYLIIKSTDSFSNSKTLMLENHTIVTIGPDYILTRKREDLREDLRDIQPKITLYKWDIQSIQSFRPTPTKQIIQIPQPSPLLDNYGIVWTPNFLFLKQYYDDYSMPMSSFQAKIFIFKYEKNSETRTNEYQYKHTYQTNHINYLFISDTGKTIISQLTDESVPNIQIHVFNQNKSVYDQIDTSSCTLLNCDDSTLNILSTLDEKFFIAHNFDNHEISAFTLVQTPDNIGQAVSNTGALESHPSLYPSEKHGIMNSPLVFSYSELSSAHGSALEQGPEFIDVLYKRLDRITTCYESEKICFIE